MEKKFTTKEVVVVAMVAAVIGVIYTLLDWAYMPLSAVLGTVFMELTFGIYMLSAMMPMYLVRKPGFAIFGALVTAGVNLLLGSPYGLQLVLAGFLEGLAVEIGYGKHEEPAAVRNPGTDLCAVQRWILLGNSLELWRSSSGWRDNRPFL